MRRFYNDKFNIIQRRWAQAGKPASEKLIDGNPIKVIPVEDIPEDAAVDMLSSAERRMAGADNQNYASTLRCCRFLVSGIHGEENGSNSHKIANPA
jgi:hypothetical protein